ncbi:hypothetical protein Gotri_022723 [Gossypium trilobum]|uniref:RNase H type-1 domain-containing protein n=1 Tax=Gossypium trilobum TaxID=34281 RepID=A0A7J9DGT1_9ROSI|nr:hypothetical protein [Gossypium trilobum]
MGYGVVARYEEGFVVGGCRGYKNMEVISERAKLVALDEGMQLARRLKIQDNTIMGQYVQETCRKLEIFVLADVMMTPEAVTG